MKSLKKKRCRHCGKLFWPDSRNGDRQHFCDKPECRKASKTDSQKRWVEKPENQDYFRGPKNVERVQDWRKNHPGYWRRKSPKKISALQESLKQQPIDNNTDTAKLGSIALQDIIKAQPLVLLGLISNITGTALQDDMAITIRRLLQLGLDIANPSIHSKGEKHGIKTAHFSTTGPAGPQTVQLAGSPSGP
jgi:hypothetical protein